MLDDLDKELEQRGHRFVRYADDCNIYMKTPRAGERVLLFDPAIAWKDQPVPLHPGAIKYYKEKGLMK